MSAHDSPARPFARAHCASCRWRARDGGPGPRKVRRAGLAPSAVPLRKQGRCEKCVCGPPATSKGLHLRPPECSAANPAARPSRAGPTSAGIFPRGRRGARPSRAGRPRARTRTVDAVSHRPPLVHKKVRPAPRTGVGRGLHHSELVVRQHVHQRRLPGIVQPHEDDLGVLLEEPCDNSGRRDRGAGICLARRGFVCSRAKTRPTGGRASVARRGCAFQIPPRGVRAGTMVATRAGQTDKTGLPVVRVFVW